jgi:replicative DNA helicase
MQQTHAQPANIDAERNLIGLTLLDGSIPVAARELATTDFFDPNHRAVWSAFLELEEGRQEIECLSALEIVKKNNPKIAEVFSVSELTDTTFGMVPRTNETVFVSKIKLAAHKRFLMRELSAQIENLSTGGAETLTTLKRKLDELEIAGDERGRFTPLGEILERDVKPALADLSRGITNRISTGFDSIDHNIGGGFTLSDVVVVAALPSAGKSSFVLQLAVNIAKQNIPVAFVSGEMSDKENGLRLLSQAAKVINLNSATHIGENEHKYLTKWADELKQLPIYFDSKTSDLQSIGRSLRLLVEQMGVKVLVIDYIQLFKTSRYDRTSRTERIAECSQEVKRIAMEYGIAVIEVAQFNREGAKSLKTSMFDLEGSGQLEKDASLVFIIDRDENSSDVTLRIVKGRNVAKCELRGEYKGMILNFEFE